MKINNFTRLIIIANFFGYNVTLLQKNLPPSANSLNCQNHCYFSISAENALSSPFSCFSCILSHVSCLQSPASCLPFPVSCSPVSSLPSHVSTVVSCLSVFLLLSPVSCLLSIFSCLSYCCFLSPVYCLTSPVSSLQCCKCSRFSGDSDFMEQISGLGPFSDLNALSGLSGLEANYS